MWAGGGVHWQFRERGTYIPVSHLGLTILLENESGSEFHSSKKTQSSKECDHGQLLPDEKHFSTFTEKKYEVYSQRFTIHVFQGSTSNSEKGFKVQWNAKPHFFHPSLLLMHFLCPMYCFAKQDSLPCSKRRGYTNRVQGIWRCLGNYGLQGCFRSGESASQVWL